MAEFTELAMERMLAALLDGGVMAALSRGDAEMDDPGYQRLPLTFTAPQRIGTSGIVAVANATLLRFGPWAADAHTEVDGWQVYSADGELLMKGKLVAKQKPSRGQSLVVDPRQWLVGLR